jgi:uncharacterized protein YktA (UPF0223 family)
LRHQKSLYELISALKNNRDINWDYWKNRELKSICKFFIEKKFCKEYKTVLDQYRAFADVVTGFHNHRETMLFETINRSPGLKNYLQIHSIFSIDAFKEGDWLNREMIKILDVKQSDIENIFKPEFVPQDILDKLSIFDPEPISIEVDSIRIEYDFWGYGGPIIVTDTDWDDLDKDIVDTTNFLSQYEPINYTPTVPSSYPASESELMDLDLPF